MLSKLKRAAIRRPASVQVIPRRIDFAFDETLPRAWYDNDIFLTHFMNALSITFPEGERMFMDAVRNVQAQVKDEQTRKDIAGFMGQEALHGRAHEAFNEFLLARGYPMDKLEAQVAADIAGHRPDHTPSSLLALTCALEHITAIMGNLLLSHPELQQMMHEEIRQLWIWHALEETEHKAVAFDVYQELYGNYVQRVGWLLLSTIGLLASVTVFQYALLQRDGANSPGRWLKGLWRMWGRKGLLTPLLPDWLEYFKPDFHPWQQDNSALITRYRAAFDRDYVAPALSKSA